MSDFLEIVAAVIMAGHLRHILQMTLAPFLAHGAVVWVADHQALYHVATEVSSLLVLDGDDAAVACRRHTGHDHGASLVVRIAVLFHRALPTRTDRTHAGMPAEVRQIEPL